MYLHPPEISFPKFKHVFFSLYFYLHKLRMYWKFTHHLLIYILVWKLAWIQSPKQDQKLVTTNVIKTHPQLFWGLFV